MRGFEPLFSLHRYGHGNQILKLNLDMSKPIQFPECRCTLLCYYYNKKEDLSKDCLFSRTNSRTLNSNVIFYLS